ncbi:hypothetical protein P9112_009222 [Eukaryota sp. TZLM1-RC]
MKMETYCWQNSHRNCTVLLNGFHTAKSNSMMKPTQFKTVSIHVIIIPIITILSIVLHAVVPAPVDDIEFDSRLVEIFGFAVVATTYFLLIFTHCALVIRYYHKQSKHSTKYIGLRFGIAFALVYQVGMQEVVVEASPFEAWGLEFVVFQFFMGFADAFPVLLLCVALSRWTLSTLNTPKISLDEQQKSVSLSRAKPIIILLSGSFSYVLQRAVTHSTGIVSSDFQSYPLQTVVWTILMGLTFSMCYLLSYREVSVLTLRNRLIAFALSFGGNWVLFNSFIGLVFKGTMLQMLFRSSLDVLVFVLTIFLVESNVKQLS